MRTNVAQNITTLKKINIHKETLSYRNQKFHSVGFFGKVKRLFLCFLLCKNTFKDCDPKFISTRLERFYNKNLKRMSAVDRKLILKKIKLFARSAKTKVFLEKIKKIEMPISKKTVKIEPPKEPSKAPSISSSATKGDESEQGLASKSQLKSQSNTLNTDVEEESESSEESSSSSYSSSETNEKENGWKNVLSDLRQGKITAEKLREYFEKTDISTLSTKRAVKIYASFMTKCNTIADFNVINFDIYRLLTKKQQGAICLYNIRCFTQYSASIYNESWAEVIRYLKVQVGVSRSDLRLIINKDNKDITSLEALEVAKWLFKQNEDLAKEFTAKLNSEQRQEILKSNLISEDEVTLQSSCSQDNSSNSSENSGADLDTSAKIDDDLPNNLEELWINHFLGEELQRKVLLVVVKKIMLNEYIDNKKTREEVLKVLRESEGNDNYKKNMQKLRSIASEIHTAKNGSLNLINNYVIPFLDAIEPENAEKNNEAM